MFLSFDHQTATFFYSCALGMAIVLLYILFDCLGKASKNKWWILLFDGLFWIVTIFVFFAFCVTAAKGEIRGYLFVGALLGGLLFQLTIGPLLRKVFSRVIFVLFRAVALPFTLYRRFRSKILIRMRRFSDKRKKTIKRKQKELPF